MNEYDTSSILIYRARDAIEGALLKAMLEEHDIEAWTAGGQSAIGFGELSSDALLVDIRVRARDVMEARRFIEAFWRDRGTPGCGPWTCVFCDEDNETGYEACWSCGAERPMRGRIAGAVGLDEGEVEVERDSKWPTWEVRTVRVWLGFGFVLLLTMACTMITRIISPALAPLLQELGLTDGVPRRSLLLGVFLAFWLPATFLIARWMFANPKMRRPAAPQG